MTAETPKKIIQSFTVGPGPRNFDAIQKACQLRKEELIHMANQEKQHLYFDFEIIEGMDNLRVNLYSATVQDVFEIGYNFCLAQKDPYK